MIEMLASLIVATTVLAGFGTVDALAAKGIVHLEGEDK